jgi:hypothetical protein
MKVIFKNTARRIYKIGCLSNGTKFHETKPLDQAPELPYCFIQPRVNSNREYKIICLGGKPRALVEVIGTGKAFKTSLDEIFEFAQKVLDRVKKNYPETIDKFIIRVDIFEVNGKLKLNELESFDANYKLNASLRNRLGGEMLEKWTDENSDDFLVNFWLSKCLSLIENINTSSPAVQKKGNLIKLIFSIKLRHSDSQKLTKNSSLFSSVHFPIFSPPGRFLKLATNL